MIAASEPLEFIPRGRLAVEEHPGPLKTKQQMSTSNDNLLLLRMQSVNISRNDEYADEHWSIQDIYEDYTDKTETPNCSTNSSVDNPSYMIDFYVNSEEELYYKGYTAVWIKGINNNESVLPTMCFTTDTPIKHAFFCNPNFLEQKQNVNGKPITNKNITSIGIIDSTSLRVYCNNGEYFLTNLEFPVSNVFQTKFGILLEKEAFSTTIRSHSIPMPRFFTLSHPLNEMCPLLYKSSTGYVSYLTEADYKIIFTTNNSDLVLLYDNKIGKHFIGRIRSATEDEVNFISCVNNESSITGVNISHRQGISNLSQGLYKSTGSMISRSNITHTTGPRNSNLLKLITNSSQTHHSINSSANSNMNRTSNFQSPLTQLQSTFKTQSISVQDLRKFGQSVSQPSKPIFPEYCLEHIWTENTNSKDFNEIALKAFTHTDLIGQNFFCYLMSQTCKLQMMRIEKASSSNDYIFGMICTVAAKDAVVLEKMKMIAILTPCGTLVLYTGPILIAKVHITSVLPNFTSQGMGTYSFPRRSSLLPTIQQPADVPFDDELHMLSPVHPLTSHFPQRGNNVCQGLRDPSGNRLTLVYSEGKMYRIALPLINESHFITKCIFALKQVIKKDLYIQLLAKWYGARNAPGSQDFSNEQEWETFKNVLSDLLGRSFSLNENNSNNSGSEEPKKRRKNENSFGSDEDWDYLKKIVNSKTAKIIDQSNSILHNDASAPLFSYIPVIFYTLHLVYEEIKLDSSMINYLKYLAEFLYSLAADMQLHSYCLHYFLDFPQLIHNYTKNFFTEDDAQKMNNKNLLLEPVPSIYNTIMDILRDTENKKYPYIYNVNTTSKNIIQLITLICHGHTKLKNWFHNLEFAGCGTAEKSKLPKRTISVNVPRSEQVIQMLLQMNMTRRDIQRLPPAINFITAQALEYSRLSPPTGCEFRAYELILRSELVAHASYNSNLTEIESTTQYSSVIKEDALTPRISPSPDIIPTAVDASTISEGDGMENIDTKLLRLRFPHDLRTTEVRRMLNSSEPVIIDIKQSAGVSDHEFIEEQEKQLYALCTRTMALPMGRGMFTLRTITPSSTESMPIPKLCLSGKEPTKGATIEMQQIEFPPNMNLWPSFHNGVAAGLRISQNAKNIDSTWIVYNKPKGQTEVSTEHAGFLMGLGLNGHLKSLSFMSIYEYLVKCDEMTGVGLLLGISATHRGTMDNTTTKLLSVHIEALLPATALELDIPQNIQVASLMGVGLLYQGTAKRHIAEVLLQEIGRPPGPEMENSIERESYALTAGLALGLVTLGQGESTPGLQDLQLPDTLHYYIVGGNKRPLTGSQKEKYKLPSFPVREGDTVNIDVTAPGAILALGLMFFNTGNAAIAQWMKPPDTSYLLDLIRPDFLLLRMIARGLILWKDIQPDFEWLANQFPSSLAFDLKKGPPDNGMDVDHEANAQAYCNIIAGAAFCIGLKYAGTENQIAFKTLKKTIDLFLGMGGQYVGEYAGKATVESCLIIVVLAISLVFAGSGNLEILRVIRYLRSRIGASYPQVTYGSHMAIHMALGFLFMGAGRYTLSKTPEAIAALVCALFPKFPNHSNDNRYHLQAFRHLYVLAVEPRLFLPRDIDTGKLCLCQISCIEIDSDEIKNLPMAPCILPELNTLRMIMVNDPNYWPVCFDRKRNWDQLQQILKNSGCIDIKKRAGCMSLLEDPDRLKSLLAQTLTTEQYSCWKIDPKALLLFSNDTKVATFTQKCLDIEKSKDDITSEEIKRSQLFMILFYKCLTKDKMHALPIYLSLLHILEKLNEFPNTQDIWQFKIINAFQDIDDGDILISREIVDSIICKLTSIMETWRDIYSEALKEFISFPNAGIIFNASLRCLQKITTVVSFYDLLPNILNVVQINNHHINYLVLLCELKKYGFKANTINCIAKLLNVN